MEDLKGKRLFYKSLLHLDFVRKTSSKVIGFPILLVKTTQSINDFNKSVQKLNLYSDRLILAAEKESLNPKQIHSLDEKAVIDATHQAAEFIISYAKLLDTVKAVESKNKVHKPVTYTEYVRRDYS